VRHESFDWVNGSSGISRMYPSDTSSLRAYLAAAMVDIIRYKRNGGSAKRRNPNFS